MVKGYEVYDSFTMQSVSRWYALHEFYCGRDTHENVCAALSVTMLMRLEAVSAFGDGRYQDFYGHSEEDFSEYLVGKYLGTLLALATLMRDLGAMNRGEQ